MRKILCLLVALSGCGSDGSYSQSEADAAGELLLLGGAGLMSGMSRPATATCFTTGMMTTCREH